jgi:hypothetical protein
MSRETTHTIDHSRIGYYIAVICGQKNFPFALEAYSFPYLSM